MKKELHDADVETANKSASLWEGTPKAGGGRRGMHVQGGCSGGQPSEHIHSWWQEGDRWYQTRLLKRPEAEKARAEEEVILRATWSAVTGWGGRKFHVARLLASVLSEEGLDIQGTSKHLSPAFPQPNALRQCPELPPLWAGSSGPSLATGLSVLSSTSAF